MIKRLTMEQLDDSHRLSEFAFQFEFSREDWERRAERFKPERHWGFFVGDKLAAQVGIIPMEIWLNGQRVQAGGLAGVGTWPEYRRGGFVRQLVQHSLTQMREEGQLLSALSPFSIAFYRRLGYEVHVDLKKMEIPMNAFAKTRELEGHIERMPYEEKSLEVLVPIYEQYASRFNGMQCRDEEWWLKNVFSAKKGTCVVYYDATDRAAGYMMYKVRERKLEIMELCGLHHQAMLALWNFVGNHDSMAETVLYTAPANDELYYHLQHLEIKQNLQPYYMARIVDAEPLLRGYHFSAPRQEQRLRLHVEDEHAPWNNGVYAMHWRADGTLISLELQPLASGEVPEQKADLCCDIRALTAMAFGYKRPRALAYSGLLRGNAGAVDALEAVLPVAHTFRNDFF